MIMLKSNKQFRYQLIVKNSFDACIQDMLKQHITQI